MWGLDIKKKKPYVISLAKYINYYKTSSETLKLLKYLLIIIAFVISIFF